MPIDTECANGPASPASKRGWASQVQLVVGCVAGVWYKRYIKHGVRAVVRGQHVTIKATGGTSLNRHAMELLPGPGGCVWPVGDDVCNLSKSSKPHTPCR